MRPDEDERSDDEDNSTSPTSPTSGKEQKKFHVTQKFDSWLVC